MRKHHKNSSKARSLSRFLHRFCIFLVLIPLFFAVGLRGQEPEELPTAEETARALAELDERLDAYVQQVGIDESLDQMPDARLELLRQTERLLQEQQDAHQRREELFAEQEVLASDDSVRRVLDLEHDPPFELDELDALLDRFDLARQSRASLDATIEIQAEALEEARGRLADARREAERVEGELEGADEAQVLELRARLSLHRLRLNVVREQERLLVLQQANDRLDRDLADQRERHLGEALAWLRARVQPSAEALRERLVGFSTEESELGRRLEGARLDSQNAQSHWQGVQQKIAGAEGPDEALQAQSEAYRARLTTARYRVDSLERRLRHVSLRREAWELRFRLLRGELTKHEALSSARASLQRIYDELERARQRVRTHRDQSQAGKAEIVARLDTAEPAVHKWLQQRLDARDELLELTRDELDEQSRALVLVERPLGEVEDKLSRLGLRARAASVGKKITGLWNRELIVVQDSPITLGKTVLAILLVVLGFLGSHALSRFLTRRVLNRFALDEGVIATLRTVIFYFSFLIFVLWALRLVNIPLTVFTFLGGALAIGVGFGSQNIVNNFMSGLILMVERPIKVGDLVDFEGTVGRVEDIGPRSTRIHTGENLHKVVPNSALLENSVVNWTHSDNRLRVSLDVGVAYGSDTDLVRREILAVLEEISEVHAVPSPEILFMDFGDSALAFRALFWITVRQPLDRHRVASAIRFRVDARFREAGITIPFPQRDVHLDLDDGVRDALAKMARPQ